MQLRASLGYTVRLSENKLIRKIHVYSHNTRQSSSNPFLPTSLSYFITYKDIYYTSTMWQGLAKRLPTEPYARKKKSKTKNWDVTLRSFSVKIILTNPSGSTFKISMFKLSDDAGYLVTTATLPGSANAPTSGNWGCLEAFANRGHEGCCSYSLWGKALSIWPAGTGTPDPLPVKGLKLRLCFLSELRRRASELENLSSDAAIFVVVVYSVSDNFHLNRKVKSWEGPI